MRKLLIGMIGILLLNSVGCSTPQKPRGFELPPALREIYRGGELAPMQNAESPDLGIRRRGPNGEFIPTNYDLVQHTCTSAPIFDLEGNYLKTITRCF